MMDIQMDDTVADNTLHSSLWQWGKHVHVQYSQSNNYNA